VPALRLIGNGMTDPRAGPDRIECDNLRDADVCKSADEDAMRVAIASGGNGGPKAIGT